MNDPTGAGGTTTGTGGTARTGSETDGVEPAGPDRPEEPSRARPGETSRIIALIPAYNEAERIGPVVTEAGRHLPVLVVDDGSQDGTAETAERFGAAVLRRNPNQGKGAALRAGFRRALEQGCEAVLTLDADGQHDPSEIPLFLGAWRAGRPELIIGARSFEQMPKVRRLSNTLGRKSFSWALGRPVRDNQSGYRLIARPLLEALLESREQGFEFEVEMVVECVRRGWRLEWVPIRTIYAGEGSHIHPLRHVWHFSRMVLQTRRRMRSRDRDRRTSG